MSSSDWDRLGDPALPEPPLYECQRVSQPIEVNGDICKPCWCEAPWTTDFVDIEGSAKPSPPSHLRTRVKMLHDGAHLYIAAQLTEPCVWGTITRRNETLYWENDFEVFVDVDGSGHDYYELEVNALNTVWELKLHKPYSTGVHEVANPLNLRGMRSAVRVRGTGNESMVEPNGPVARRRQCAGWDLEIALPIDELLAHYAFRQRPSQSIDGAWWRVNFSRVQWDTEVVVADAPAAAAAGEAKEVIRKVEGRPEHNWVWSPTGLVDAHRPERWGWVHFAGGGAAGGGKSVGESAHARERVARAALVMACYDMVAAEPAQRHAGPTSLYGWWRPGSSAGLTAPQLARAAVLDALHAHGLQLPCCTIEDGDNATFVLSVRLGDNFVFIRSDRLLWKQKGRLPPGHSWASWVTGAAWDGYAWAVPRAKPFVPKGHTPTSWFGESARYPGSGSK